MKLKVNYPIAVGLSKFDPSYKQSQFGLAALLRARSYARDADADAWEFALEIEELRALGLGLSEVRWLVVEGFAEHGIDVSAYGDTQRSFEVSPGLNFKSRTCLVLTDAGAVFAGAAIDPANSEAADSSEEQASRNGVDARKGIVDENPSMNAPLFGDFKLEAPSSKPHWNSARRELRFGDVLVKKFRVPARNQEWILEVFEEDGWPEHIDDPLPPSPDICSKSRLHDAINRLNGKQANPVLRFHGNGNGNGLYWEQVGMMIGG